MTTAPPTPPIAARRFSGSGGLALAADAYGDAKAPPAILLHGGGQTRHSWAGTAKRLAQAGWYAICVDLRGHGESDWDPSGEYANTSFRDDTIAVARSFDVPPVLIGASLGGLSALLAIHEAGSDLARALVLVDIATRMEADGTDRIIEFMQGGADGFASLDEVADAVAAYNPHRPRPDDVSGLAKNLRLGDDGRYRWHWDPEFLKAGPHEQEEFITADHLDAAATGLRLPTLLVRGRQSDLLSAEGARIFLEQVPHADFADVSGAGHMVAGDKNDAFSQAVLDFLEKRIR